MKLAALLFLAACATEPYQDVTGPFTGQTHRFVVDRIDLPTRDTEIRNFAGDLDGDGNTDNKLGLAFAELDFGGNVTRHGGEMIAAGKIASTIEIVADDLTNDASVSVLYRGAEGEDAVAVGGKIVDGHFYPNPTSVTTAPGYVRAHLPVFVDADPTVIDLEGLELDLVDDRAGGYDVLVRGLVDPTDGLRAAYIGTSQMIAADPGSHMFFMGMLDRTPRDWKLTQEEFLRDGLMVSLFDPDITYRGAKRVSIGYRMHISPCAEGRCAPLPVDACHDRVKDGVETDVDCGGGCGKCPERGHCSQASDCLSGVCDDAVCAAPSCSDGVRDGFETDVDCGSECSAKCSVGQQCYSDYDCKVGHTCGEPCKDDDWFCDDFDHCQ